MCDDCSKDSTYEIAKSYSEKYKEKIKLIKNKENLGLAGSLNRCLEYVSGDYIARQDGDDKSVPDRLKKQIEFLERNSEYDLTIQLNLNFLYF